MIGDNLIIKVDVNNFFDRATQIREILYVSTFMQHGSLSTNSTLNHHLLRVERISNFHDKLEANRMRLNYYYLHLVLGHQRRRVRISVLTSAKTHSIQVSFALRSQLQACILCEQEFLKD